MSFPGELRAVPPSAAPETVARLVAVASVDGHTFALYLRRLERGTFAFPAATAASVPVAPTQLARILGGLDPAKARERPRYKTPT